MTEQQLAAMRQALEALEYAQTGNRRPEVIGTAITTLCTAIEQAETAQGQEPVALAAYDKIDRFLRSILGDEDYAEYSEALDAIYTTPPAQEFVCSTGLCHYRKPLTDDAIYAAAEVAWRSGWAACRDAEFVGEEAEDEAWGYQGATVAQDIEAKLKEKNGGQA